MFSHGLVVGKFAPFHAGHQLVLETAQRECREVTVLVYSNPDFVEMPQAVRARWIRTLYPALHVLEPQGAPPNDADDETHRAFVKRYLETAGIAVDAVFTSEDYGPGFAAYLGVPHRMVDRQRLQVPVSGTRLRGSMYDFRQFLSPVVYRHFVRTVVFLGAESTGKSTLTAHLAEAMGTAYVHEHGRDYHAARGGVLDLDDYVTIAREHMVIEDSRLMDARDVLFIDTNALTTLFYSYYYNGGARRPLHEIAEACLERYDYSFVCDADIPFEQDGWRDTAELRAKSQSMVLMELDARRVAYDTVSGSVAARADKVIRAIATPSPRA